MVKRGFKSPYDYFTTATEYQGKKALIIMNGLLDLHNVLSELKPKDTSGSFQESEVLEVLEDLKDVLPFTHYDYQRKGVIDTLTGPTKTIGRYCTGCLDGDSLIDVYVNQELKTLTYKEVHECLDNSEFLEVNTPNGLTKINKKFTKEEEGVLITYTDGTETKCAISHHLCLPELKPANLVRIGDTNGIKTVSSVEKMPEQLWYDFEIDKDDGLYYQNDIIHHNSGKSLIISTIVEFFRRKGMKGILLVPNINLLTQFHNDIEEYNLKELHADTELIGGGRSVKNINELTKTLTISTWQSMANFEGDLGELDFVIADECVHPETLITTDKGLKEIQYLNAGDLVLTINEETKEQEYKPIEKVHKNLRHSKSEQMYEIEMEDGSKLNITGNHKVQTQRGWVRADELTLEDSIIKI